MNEKKENYSIEEYKTLREEILLRVRLQFQAVIFSGTAFFLALTFLSRMEPYKFNVEYWGLMLLLMINPFYLMYRMHVFAIAKIASYIEKCIEPDHDGLNWTGSHILSSSINNYENLSFLDKFNVSINIISMYFFTMTLISWVLPWKLNSGAPSIWVLAAMGFLTLIIIGNYISLRNYKTHRKAWMDIWEKIRKKTD